MISLDKTYSSPPKWEITALLTEAKTLKIILLEFNKNKCDITIENGWGN